MFIAVRTGLEPATPGVTGQAGILTKLNYRTKCGSLVGVANVGIYCETAKFFLRVPGKFPCRRLALRNGHTIRCRQGYAPT